MLLSELDYELPSRLIAQQPLDARDASRMLVVERTEEVWTNRLFVDLSNYLRAGDLIVLNNTRVFPARLVGRRVPSGGAAELFLVRELAPLVWETLARPGKRLREGARVSFGRNGDARLEAEVLSVTEDGRRVVRFNCAADFNETIDQVGLIPLPPYIKRNVNYDLLEVGAPEDQVRGNEADQVDRERYQTVFARERGAIAAPTAGLHFTPEALETLKQQGVEFAEITLHVGYGTFEPVRVKDLSEHAVAPETCEISLAAAEKINGTKRNGGRVLAVGTTVVRALESSAKEAGDVIAGQQAASLTITPGYRFRVVDMLLTNFHLPRSSLLALVAAFAGRDLTIAAYAHAVQHEYRFYSYGDCMLII